MISYGIPTVARVGHGRARCDTLAEPYTKGRPRCEQTRFHHRPRCEHLGINRVHLDLAFVRLWVLECNCGVCVGIEYFNYACRHLPSPNFFAADSTAKPLLTVQKMPNHSNLWHRGHHIAHSCPPYPPWYTVLRLEPLQFWHTIPANPLIMHTFI